MKKKKILIIALFGLIIGINTVYARDTTVNSSISVSTTSTVIGNSGTATFTISSNGVLGQVYGTFSCGGLGSVDLYYYNNNGATNKSKSYTISWTAKSAGTYTCSVSGLQVGTLTYPGDGVFDAGSPASKTIVVVSGSSGGTSGGSTSEKKTYSSDNTLSSLSIEGQEISPKFDKNTLEYKLEVDESIEKININAKANDSNATVSGTGEKSLTTGENTFEIKVTAENGNDKIYKIIVTVEDKNPIEVTIDDKKYTIVKKNHDVIDKPEYYEESTIKINDQDVICYKNEENGITLVILKDEEGKVNYYIYDEKNKTYELYQEIKISNLTFSILKMDKNLLPEGYKKYTFKIGETELEGYSLKKNSKFHLIYAMNVETGEKSLYVYDEKEGTIQRYNDELVKYYEDKYESEISKYKRYFYISLSAFAAVTIVLIVVIILNHKGKKSKNKLKK